MSNARNIASIAGEDVLNASNEIVPVYACRAWVNFDGTTNTAGFCTIRDSGNVSTVADNGTGNYTVNFATAMPDTNYSPVFIAGKGGAGITSDLSAAADVLTTSFDVRTRVAGSSTLIDADIVACAIFR